MKKQKLSEKIYEDLRKRILAGEYQVNEKLPPERELAQRYDTSRVPVRDALKKLAEEGVVQTMLGSGTIVLAPGGAICDDGASASFFDEDVILSETIQLRSVLESEAARQAAHNRTAEDIKNIQSALFESVNEVRKLKAGENNSFFEADVQFHKAIAQASHNRLFIECLDAIPNLMASHQFWSLKYSSPRDEVVSFHTVIYESILDADGERAYDSMKTHLTRVGALLQERAARGGGAAP